MKARKTAPIVSRPPSRAELFSHAERACRTAQEIYSTESAIKQAQWSSARNPFIAWAWWMTSEQCKRRQQMLAQWRQAKEAYAIAEKKYGPRKETP